MLMKHNANEKPEVSEVVSYNHFSLCFYYLFELVKSIISINIALCFAVECDENLDCSDGSDEFGSCDEDELTCDCLIKKSCRKCNGCINTAQAKTDGFINCPREKRIPFGTYGKINIYRLNNVSECNEIGFPQCDNSTCITYSNFSSTLFENAASSYLTCTSFCSDQQYCDKKAAFQCSDNSFIFHDHFCDGVVDCVDGSDELVNTQGFKCDKCILPQNSLYDNLAQCDDNSDLCFVNKGSCFQCLDKRLLISSKQVCDGVNDCYDLSDECLCDIYFATATCGSRFQSNDLVCFDWLATSHSSLKIETINAATRFVACQTKYGLVQAKPCDGRPECKDFKDECECNNPPSFCNDTCHAFFPMGDRYCDGKEDVSWIYLNKTLCPKGFDELECPKRFKCNASGSVSVDVLQNCDGKSDCDDGSDEINCPEKENEAIFSSDNEMIAEPGIKAAFWIMGFIVLLGNACVIVDTAKFLKTQKALDFAIFQRVIVLNISIADFIMGVYLITIAAYSQVFSGIYGLVNREWRSSLKCSIIGSLSVLSSEASCLFMVALTAFRLTNVCNPVASMTSSILPWKLSIAITWLLSLCLSIIPIVGVAPLYFVHSISFSSKFHQNGSIKVAQLKQFLCRYAILSNTTVKDYGNELESIKIFLEANLPDSLPVQMFGYYGETSVCMPRFYVASGEPSWEYTLSLITFNLFCFVFIAAGYLRIYQRSKKSSEKVRSNRSEQQAARMQKRIARIIATDFCCWIPICVMAYVRFGVDFSNIVYQISAVFLLPINSVLNPLLFSTLPDKLFDFCKSKLPKSFKSGC